MAFVAYRMHLLTKSGAIAASVVGSAVFAGTGVRGSVTLMMYFLSASLLSQLPRPAVFAQSRGSKRDAIQVLANGGVPSLLAAIHFHAPARRRPVVSLAYASAVAAAAADTWATELGGRYGANPRSIVTGRRVTPGVSGGVSLLGLAATAAGSALIALTATALGPGSPREISHQRNFLAISTAGVAGSLVDSLVGATLQEARFCHKCSTSTELPTHACGAKSMLMRGVPGWNNDVTNVVGIVSGMVVGIAMEKLNGRSRLTPTPWNDELPPT